MAKRLFDIAFAFFALTVSLPVIATACFLIWASDGRWPFYAGNRVGRGGLEFRMFKLRTMIVGAEQFGGSSTSVSDHRLIPLGRSLRRLKIDELPQFWNVLVGDMSVVGPRPNVLKGGVDRYTSEERRLLSVRPGITDLASIVFSDEGEILKGSRDPDALYDSTIRPWKNRLGLIYVDGRSMLFDLRLIWLTGVAIFSRVRALREIDRILDRLGADAKLKRICRRDDPLPHGLPPGDRTQFAAP
jgi:lipopolysaccharide/colanic/teichoic acid biosynthesis glycosyltransferase